MDANPSATQRRRLISNTTPKFSTSKYENSTMYRSCSERSRTGTSNPPIIDTSASGQPL